MLNKAVRDIGIYEEGMAFHSLRRLAASTSRRRAATTPRSARCWGHADGGRLAGSTYLRPVGGLGDELPENVIPMPKACSRLHPQTAAIAQAPITTSAAPAMCSTHLAPET